MSTRSTIAIQHADGSVDQIYAHWDGYLQGVGATLLEHYQDRKKVQDLIAHGDVSVLGPEIGVKQDFNSPIDGMCLFYARDRGEDGVQAMPFVSLSDYEQNHQYEEYEYLFTADNVWSVFYNDDWHDLEYELQQLEEVEEVE